MIFRKLLVPALLVVTLGGCANMNSTEQRTLSGGAIGAAGGAVITAVTGGCIACGAVIGGAIGAIGGLVVDQVENRKEAHAEESRRVVHRRPTKPGGKPVAVASKSVE